LPTIMLINFLWPMPAEIIGSGCSWLSFYHLGL
jgi:hypothetical protein